MLQPEQVHRGTVLLLYYSAKSWKSLERGIRNQGFEVIAIDGRAPSSADLILLPATDVVVVDRSPSDINVGQAVRHLGHLLPRSPIIAVYPDRASVEVFRAGHRIAVLPSFEAAILGYGREDLTEHREV